MTPLWCHDGVMDLNRYVDDLQRQLATAAAAGGDETREVAERLGLDVSKFQGPLIPVVYNVNYRDPAGYFLATKFQMRNKDVLFASNASAVEQAKVMNYIRLVTATANDPIVASTNALVLRSTIRNLGP